MPQPQCVVYVDGTPHPTDAMPADALADARRRGGMLWVGITTPDPDEIRSVAQLLGLERIGVEGALRTHQRSKLDRFGDHLFVVVQPSQYDDATEAVHCSEVDLFVGKDFVVVISADGAVDTEKLRALLDEHPDIAARGPLGVLWGTFEYVTRGYREVMDGIEHDIDEIEEELFGEDEGVSRRIFALQREVIDLRHATAPLPGIMDRLEHYVGSRMPSGEAPGYREIADRARYIDARVAAFRETLDNALTIHATIVDQRRNDQMSEMTRTSIEQNDQVKKISSWAAIGFAPTLVAGIYGMNFQNMPELAWPWGYPFALGLMVAVSAGLYAVFKKKDWI
ncbi:magnesium and cobalt transport protein CorA [Microbacterium sp. VKM Ac-2870]|uniref:magnesium and cobalt transport protein CorA n=1 Tax=Microbacterium sp. VKM Ac-2870 TaxID=2783825 RepID=UPI00188D8317|nr:magnesium and cobalt transport protein CorA [Microbacterium sp. VKM Ac-2870]MBF4563232.1 magnesium and cobalt transport protein CorA [Microbacterium sp. VKM Ac-2870]